MSLQKTTYLDHKTPIMAKNLNDIQDAIKELQDTATDLSGVFWAIYSVTTNTEVTAALSAGKFVAMTNSGYTYVLSLTETSGDDKTYHFSCVTEDSIRTCTLSPNGWGPSSVHAILTSDVFIIG